MTLIQSAVNQDIAVFTVDTFIEKDIALANISSDNIEGGRPAAKALAEAINERGKVFCISVTPGISTTDQREQGFEDGLEACSLTSGCVDIDPPTPCNWKRSSKPYGQKRPYTSHAVWVNHTEIRCQNL